MRGKLRDKRPTQKRDANSHENLEQRRPYKRDSRMPVWFNNQSDEEEYDIDELEEGEEAQEIKILQKK